MKTFKSVFTLIATTSIVWSTLVTSPAVPVQAVAETSPAVTEPAKSSGSPGVKPGNAQAYKPGVISADQLTADASHAKAGLLTAIAANDEYLLDVNGTARVIIDLIDPPLTNYVGALSVTAKRSYLGPVADGGRLDANSASSLAYRAQLQKQQDAVISTIASGAIGGKLNVTYRYDVAFNGFATSVPLSQIDSIRALPGIKAIYPDRIMTLRMDASLPLIGAPQVWDNISTTLGITEAGKGVKIAIVDSGIDNANPFFTNTGVYTYPAGYPKGYCVTTPSFCNGKIIAARYYTQSSSVNISETLTPLDADGHGTHVAGTTAGNLNTEAQVSGITATVSGVAPFAYLMAYKGLWLNVAGDNGSGESSGLIQAI
ncbi:MAG TPA: S8 family serine peptidase, partial [Anaerolineae bacterium]